MAVRHPHGEPSDLIRSVSRALRVLEAVGQTPRGLTVKQIARRCDLTTATTYHLIRTLAYEGYVARREDGTYVVGLEIADRFRELVAAFRGPATVGEALRQAAADTGYSHYLGTFVGGQVVLASAAEGPQSPYLEDLVPGFDDGAHATALGKALLATLTYDQRLRYLKDWGMRAVHRRPPHPARGAGGRPARRRAAGHAGGDHPVPLRRRLRGGDGPRGPRPRAALRAGLRHVGRPAPRLGQRRADPPRRARARAVERGAAAESRAT